jgi:hypothetical protein
VFDVKTMERVGEAGSALIGVYVGWKMTQFTPKAQLGYEQQLVPVVKFGGYLMMAYSAYNALREYLAK